nr:putative sigma factor [uncultured Mediterranean phage uvMED]
MADSILRNPDGQFTSERARKDGRVCGRRQPDVVIEARRQKLYKRQLEGKTTRQLVLEHAATEGIGIETAWTDWRKVKSWNDEDWEKDREKMVSRLQGMRMKLFNQAMKKGQLQTAAQVLDSLGRVLGESVENININAPQLSISVEDKKK